jgi:alkylation response protein AidB-like acyl-CoA dehydrogenase
MSTIAPSIDAIRAMAPLIREHADATESERRLPEPVVRALLNEGVFNLLVPRSLGGAEADPLLVCQMIEELSMIDGSTGWCAMLGASYGLFAGLLPEETAREIYGNSHAIVAGSFGPRGVARIVPDGYLVRGRWAFGSGIMHSTWVIGGCRIESADSAAMRSLNEASPVRVFFFPTRDVEVLDTWHVAGLKGTGSHDYAVTDLLVPTHRAFALTEEPVQPGPLYTLPAVALFTAMIACVPLGIARHALDALRQLAGGKTPVRSQTVLREHAQLQSHLGEAEGALRAGRAFLYDAVEEAWHVALQGRRLTWEERGLVWLAATQAVTQALHAVDLMFRAGGATSIYITSPLERCLRDIRTAAQHHVIGPSNYEVAGKLLLGFDVAGTLWGRDYRGDA